MTLANLKTRLGIPIDDLSQDQVLPLILADAQAFFKDHCHRDDIPEEAESVVARLAVVFYDRNADQYKQHITVGEYSSTNYTTEDDIPKSIKSQLRRYRVVKFL